MPERKSSWVTLLAVLVLFFFPSALGQALKGGKPALSSRGEKWAQKTLKGMSLEEKLGQLLLVYYYGGFTSTESQEYKDLLEQVERNHVGGFVVRTRGTSTGFARSQVYPTAALANQLQRRAKVPLLVAADFERGTAMRLDEGTSFPHAMGVAATGRVEDAYTMGKITAQEARATGVHWIFAPVADVNSNPGNPIINTRSFGEDPARVGELVAAFIRGVEENGALSTSKHFPGHGDTSVDSHIDLPTVKGDRARLDAVELAPFRAAIAAGTSTIMTGHLALPALEPNTEIPATLSPHVLTGLLRHDLGFDGLVVTDALDMGGVTVRYPPAEVAVRSIAAGADVLLVPPITDAALAALKDAVGSGRLPMSRIDEAVTRVLRAKARLELHRQRFVDLDALNGYFRRPEFVAQAQEIADRGVTLLRDDAGLLPLDATRPQRVLLLAVSGDPEAVPAEDFEREMRWRVERLDVVRTDTRFSRAELVKLPPPESYDVAVAALFARVADRKATVGLPDNQAALVNQLLAAGKPVVVACFGNPYLIERFPAAQTWVAAFSTVDVAQRAVARALFGQTAIAGRMPVSVPGIVPLGHGLSVAASAMKLRDASPEMRAKLQPAFDLLERGVADRAFPGGVLAVGLRGEVLIHPFGRQTYEARSPAVTADTLYDLASVTKPVVIGTALAMLVAAGRVQLDAPIARYIPEWAAGPQPEWRAKVTVRHLLLHNSGLPANLATPPASPVPAKSRRQILEQAYELALESEPGIEVRYSNPGFMLLGEIVERIAGKPLDAFARERIFAPLGMNDSMFNPPAKLRSRVAPTVNDTALRKRLLQGETHSDEAWIMGGVTAFTGLFSTAPDLAAFCQMLLNGGIYAHERILRRPLIQQFTARQAVGPAQRALGWTMSDDPWASARGAGRHFSARAFGHPGITGTSVWIDPEKELFIVLLTNSAHPSLANEKIYNIRTVLHDAIFESLGLAPSSSP